MIIYIDHDIIYSTLSMPNVAEPMSEFVIIYIDHDIIYRPTILYINHDIIYRPMILYINP